MNNIVKGEEMINEPLVPFTQQELKNLNIMKTPNKTEYNFTDIDRYGIADFIGNYRVVECDRNNKEYFKEDDGDYNDEYSEQNIYRKIYKIKDKKFFWSLYSDKGMYANISDKVINDVKNLKHNNTLIKTYWKWVSHDGKYIKSIFTYKQNVNGEEISKKVNIQLNSYINSIT